MQLVCLCKNRYQDKVLNLSRDTDCKTFAQFTLLERIKTEEKLRSVSSILTVRIYFFYFFPLLHFSKFKKIFFQCFCIVFSEYTL